jgi:hypothetical protein
MMSIVEETEKKWLRELFDFVRSLFAGNPIPSHDHLHHLRVWRYAAGLMNEISARGVKISPGDAEDLIFACLFHDTGLTVDTGPDHGKAGFEICKNYLEKKRIRLHDQKRVLEAIANHDDKSYTGMSSLIDGEKLNILKVLAISDDLDAFGRTGIYRYSEIYLMRGIPMEDIGLKIMANLAGRFANFIDTCSFLPDVIRIHVPRHNVTENFFRNYNLQIRLMEKETSRPDTGPVGVVREIFRHTMAGADNISSVCDEASSSTDDSYVLHFFRELKTELEQDLPSFYLKVE